MDNLKIANKMDNLEEMDKMKLWFKNLQKNKSPGPDGFTGEFCHLEKR